MTRRERLMSALYKMFEKVDPTPPLQLNPNYSGYDVKRLDIAFYSGYNVKMLGSIEKIICGYLL